MPNPNEFLPHDTRIATIKRLKDLMRHINDKKGSKNCGLVALRLNEILCYGPKPEHAPVSTADARIDTMPECVGDEIVRSYTEDPRLLALHQGVRDEVSYDFTDDREVIEIDIDTKTTAEANQKLKLTKVNRVDVVDTLRRLPQDKYDRAYGFLIYTWSNLKKRTGHIVNFYVDKNKEVYFLDAQGRDPKTWVLEKPPTDGYRDELFYFNSLPPKQHILVKIEPLCEINPANMVKTEPLETSARLAIPSPFAIPASLEMLAELAASSPGIRPPSLAMVKHLERIAATAATDVATPTINILGDEYLDTENNRTMLNILELLQKSLSATEEEYIRKHVDTRNEKLLDLAKIAGIKNNQELCMTLLGFGASLQSMASGAAFGGHLQLMKELISREGSIGPGEKPKFLKMLGANAAQSGHKALLDYLIELLQSYKCTPSVQYFAEVSAEHGHTHLVDFLTTSSSSSLVYQKVAESAARGGHGSLMNKLLELASATKGRHDLQGCAEKAAEGNQPQLIHDLIQRITANREGIKLNRLATSAAKGGHSALLNDLIIFIQEINKNPKLSTLAESSAEAGHCSLTFELIARMIASRQKPNFQSLTECAIKSNNVMLIDALIERMIALGQKPNFQSLTECAIKYKHTNLIYKLIKQMINFGDKINLQSTVDYIIRFGNLEFARSCLEKIITTYGNFINLHSMLDTASKFNKKNLTIFLTEKIELLSQPADITAPSVLAPPALQQTDVVRAGNPLFELPEIFLGHAKSAAAVRYATPMETKAVILSSADSNYVKDVSKQPARLRFAARTILEQKIKKLEQENKQLAKKPAQLQQYNQPLFFDFAGGSAQLEATQRVARALAPEQSTALQPLIVPSFLPARTMASRLHDDLHQQDTSDAAVVEREAKKHRADPPTMG